MCPWFYSQLRPFILATWHPVQATCVVRHGLAVKSTALVFEQQSVGLSLGCDTWYVKLGRFLGRFLTQAYIRMDCKWGNPVLALGVGSNGPWQKIIVAHTLKWPWWLVCLANCINKTILPDLKLILQISCSEYHIFLHPEWLRRTTLEPVFTSTLPTCIVAFLTQLRCMKRLRQVLVIMPQKKIKIKLI